MEIKNRYGDIWEFIKVSGGYKFKIPDYTSIGRDDNGGVFYIDPPGGPLLSLGISPLGYIKRFDLTEEYIFIEIEEA